MAGSLRGGLEVYFSGGATLPLRLFSMSGSDSRLPAAQSLAASPFTGLPFPARPLPAQPSVRGAQADGSRRRRVARLALADMSRLPHYIDISFETRRTRFPLGLKTETSTRRHW